MEHGSSSQSTSTHAKPQLIPLSSGLGLGTLRPISLAKNSAVSGHLQPSENPSKQSKLIESDVKKQPLSKSGKKFESSHRILKKKQQKKPRSAIINFLSWLKRLVLMLVIDISFVLVNIVVGIVGSCLALYIKNGKFTSVFDLYPVAWILSQAPIKIVCGLLAVYIVYTLAFILVVGSTIGSMSTGFGTRKS